jgi:hypothetical protein
MALLYHDCSTSALARSPLGMPLECSHIDPAERFDMWLLLEQGKAATLLSKPEKGQRQLGWTSGGGRRYPIRARFAREATSNLRDGQ